MEQRKKKSWEISGVFMFERDTMFVLFCATCSRALMQWNNDPNSDLYSHRLMESTIQSHLESFTRPHSIDLINMKKGTCTNPAKPRYMGLA